MRVLRGSSLWLLCVVCVASFQLCCAASLRARLRSGHGDDLRVFIASFPATHNILYSTVPSADQELVWKPLVEEGVVQKPTALVCDKYRKKLYVADGSSATIVSFEMVLQEDQSISLIDETPTTVAEHMNVVGLTVGANGDLYVSGLLSGASDTMGIFKFSAVYLQAGTLQVPETLWTQVLLGFFVCSELWCLTSIRGASCGVPGAADGFHRRGPRSHPNTHADSARRVHDDEKHPPTRRVSRNFCVMVLVVTVQLELAFTDALCQSPTSPSPWTQVNQAHGFVFPFKSRRLRTGTTQDTEA